MFTYIHAFLIDKDLCECQKVSNKFPCALLFVSSIWRSLHFLARVFLFFSYFYVIDLFIFWQEFSYFFSYFYVILQLILKTTIHVYVHVLFYSLNNVNKINDSDRTITYSQ